MEHGDATAASWPLPVELVVHVASFLDDADRMALALADVRSRRALLPSHRSLELRSCHHLKAEVLERYAAADERVEGLDVGHCYWIDAERLTDAACRWPRLRHLAVAGVALQASHVVRLLRSCPQLTSLSVSLDGRDATFWQVPFEAEDVDDVDGGDVVFYRVNSVFYECRQQLGRLTRLRLHGDSYCPVIFSILLSWCGNLEELHVELSTRYQASFGENIRMARLVGRLAPLQPACAELRRLSVVVAGRRDNGIVTRFLVALLLTKQCRLAVFWCPEVYIDNLVVQLSDHDELRAAASSDHTAAFDSLVSVDGQCGLGRLVDRLPRLRLLGCVCDDPPLFEPLAATHPHLTALHLKDASWSRDAFGHVPNVTLEPLGPLQVVPANSAAVRERRLGDGFKYLARLQKVALAPQLLADGAVLRRLVDDCPFLNELEIVDWSDDSLRKTQHPIETDALAQLSCCRNLERLTLSGIQPIDAPSGDCGPLDGYLTTVLKRCPKLASLRVSHVTGAGEQLVAGLASASHLVDFRLEQQHVEDLTALLDSLNRITSLRRWVVLVSSGGATLPEATVDGWWCPWPSWLVAAWLVAPDSPCDLRPRSTHPAFQWCLGVQEATRLAQIHYDDLAVFDSKVCKRPL